MSTQVSPPSEVTQARAGPVRLLAKVPVVMKTWFGFAGSTWKLTIASAASRGRPESRSDQDAPSLVVA